MKWFYWFLCFAAFAASIAVIFGWQPSPQLATWAAFFAVAVASHGIARQSD